MSKSFKTKYIFVTGGVTSSLGKGIVSASIGRLLKARGHKVTIQKLDPYINVDPGTMNPYEHGECYVTHDGAETDLDLGHYERFLDSETRQENNVTAGRIYQSVIEKERKGDYLGKTVQVIPHITNEIKDYIKQLEKTENYDIIITEVGGTVGDIESLPFIEAIRQLKWELETDSICIHLTLVPFLSAAGELKTKPTQNSVKKLRELGLQADVLVCRAEYNLNDEIRNKIALFCNVEKEAVIQCIDANSIYDVPLLMQKEKLDKVILNKLRIKESKKVDLKDWKNFLTKLNKQDKEVTIGIIGKYVELRDSYKSITESLIHAGAYSGCKAKISWIHSEEINKETSKKLLSDLDGVLVAPGFGDRGVEGKIEAVSFARKNKIPFFGICLGMQCAVIEYARNVLDLKDANSTEINKKTSHPVIDIMETQKVITKKGGTMRLGSYKCKIEPGSLAMTIYKQNEISERHRHRFEFNNEYLKKFQTNGVKTSGINPKTKLVEIIELNNHPFFIGVQFHPEYKSTVTKPHPLFLHFIEATLKHKES